MTSACTWALAFSSSKSHKAEGHSDAFPQELMLASMPRGKDAPALPNAILEALIYIKIAGVVYHLISLQQVGEMNGGGENDGVVRSFEACILLG